MIPLCFKKYALLSSALSAVLALSSAAAPQSGTMANRTPQTTLILGGVDAGPITAFDKGGCYAELITTASSDPRAQPVKRLGRVRNESLQLALGLTNPAQVYEWIRLSWSGQAARKSGQLLVRDATRVSPLSREFANALVAETTIPSMDKEGRDAVWLSFKVRPEAIQFITGQMEPNVAPPVRKGSLVQGDFVFEITGMDCSGVTKVEEFSVTLETVESPDPEGARVELRPGRVVFPNIRLTVLEAGAQPFIDWHQAAVVRADNGSAQRKQGKFILLSKAGGKRLVITLKNLGIVRVCPAKQVGDSTKRRLEVELFVDSMDFAVEDIVTTASARSLATLER